MIAVLFFLHLLYLIFRLRSPQLNTQLAIPSGVLAAVTTLAAGFQSVLEDQRSLNPSDLLVLYFSASAILAVPRLRTLWMFPSNEAPKALWTVILVITSAVVVLESARKTRFLRSIYQNATREQTASFWSRGFFTWVLPFFRVGYKSLLDIDNISRVDDALEEESTWNSINSTWHSVSPGGNYRLVRATAKAYIWPILSAVPPRLALSAFTFSLPFLIETVVSHLQRERDSDPDHEKYGHALVGAFILAYVGISVRYWHGSLL